MSTKKQIVYLMSQFEDQVKILKDKIDSEITEIEIKIVNFDNSKKGIFDRNLQITESDIKNLSEAEILIIDNLVIGQVYGLLPKLKWIQGTFAGMEITFNRDNDLISKYGSPKIPITRFSGSANGILIFDYCLYFIIGNERGFSSHISHQGDCDWQKLKNLTPKKFRLLSEIKITILGVGSIGKHVSLEFSKLGSHVIGYSRSDKDSKFQIENGFKKITTDLKDAISDTDYIISILPDTPATRGLLNPEILKLCKPNTCLINVGRGTLITEDDLLISLDKNYLSAAILDVFEKEPLRAESRLWTHEKVIVTPHVGAETKAEDLAQFFNDNYRKFKAGDKNLECLINFEKGY